MVRYCLGFVLFVMLFYGFLRPRVKKYIAQFKTKKVRVIFKSLFWLLLFYAVFQLILKEGIGSMLAFYWIFCVPYYFYRSMRVVYSRGRYKTMLSYCIIFISYILLWVVMLLITAAFAGYNY